MEIFIETGNIMLITAKESKYLMMPAALLAIFSISVFCEDLKLDVETVAEYTADHKLLVAGYCLRDSHGEYTIKHGHWEMYYPNGMVLMQKEYINGKENGPYKTFFPDGKVENDGAYRNGTLEGSFAVYYPSGKLKSKMIYVSGARDGAWETYFENGKVSQKGNYGDGLLRGPVSVMKGESGPELKLLDQDGSGILSEWYANGEIKCEIIYEKGLMNGEGKTYFISGHIETQTQYRNGEEYGTRKMWNDKGALIGQLRIPENAKGSIR